MKPDFRRIAAETLTPDGDRYNFHTHTQFCDGHDTMEEIAAAAVGCGMRHVGFTPHSPIPIASPCNMNVGDVTQYRAHVERLGQKYAGTCRFYTGMEIDFLGLDCNAASAFYKDLELDFCISSVHFIPSQSGEFIDIDGHADRFRRNMHEYFRDNIDYVVKTYFERSMEMLAIGGFDILGHLDKIGQNASSYSPGIEGTVGYNDLLETYLKEIVASGVIVEVNTKARAEHGRFYPHERLWQTLLDCGVPLIINSDAHRAAAVDASRAEAVEILRKLKYGH